jgi:hypothetical protein
LAPDPASVQLQRLRERLSAHADKLPPDLYDELQELIEQAQADAVSERACIMHERWRAVCESIEQGNSQEVAFDDAAARLADTPAACGPDMMKKDFDAVQRARRGRLVSARHRYGDEIHPARIGSSAALAFWAVGSDEYRQYRVILAGSITWSRKRPAD